MSIELIIQIIFWIMLFLIFWTYFGYLITMKVISFFRSKEVKKQAYSPEVSLIITAYNEEKNIGKKIENSLAQDYLKDKLEIIVVSDGSTDKTIDIVRSYQDKGVKLLSLPARHGKHYGQGKGIEMAKSDIIVLSDAATFLKHDAVEKIVRNFVDPKIGCVSGIDEIQNADSKSHGEGTYIKYEMKLRALESAVNSLVGVSGSFFAFRKYLCQGWIDNMSSDFYMPILSYINGYRTVLEKEAVGYYEVLNESQKEFTRKVRTVVHGMEVLFRFKGILNPFKYGLYSCQMISHKLLRWLVPLYLVFLFWSNLLLISQNTFFLITLILQVVFYMLAIFASLIKGLKNILIFRIPLFFVMVNYSIVVAWHNYFIGRNFVLWEPTKR
jgi:cellulose synthase/poly-beta-1,6-N-acetylglucosamine synthase-like glycosyltransferase